VKKAKLGDKGRSPQKYHNGEAPTKTPGQTKTNHTPTLTPIRTQLFHIDVEKNN